ncbi:MAG: alpha/beta fold hydrolase [Anaerolineales bacterium]|nr:alpha/beta fold hydrolase [Anaerolineales bacterium]
MSFIDVNGANLYYQVYGKDTPRQAPVLLIHGSTITGQVDWELAAPILARRWRVIVPDCRGHGQSANPHHSYSFTEMAADMAALVRLLGYEKAHIIGHSNGGNVALVTLMEHPEIVQSAVLQAANAYVSQDLIEKEPPIFDPERVQREAPEWMESMIALHGSTHGPDYWRELLQLTLQAIITEPNYSPAELGRVELPTLVIQGEKDRVNAPAQHAQFIAEHIPYAELWLPTGIGHNVHDEILFQWIERVENFLERRGDSANEALHRLGRDHYADEREGIFGVKSQYIPSTGAQPGRYNLTGRVLNESQRLAALECVTTAAAPQNVSAEGVAVLLSQDTPWALVNRGVSDIRREPRSLAERVSQVLLGEAVRILQEGPDWCWVRSEQDGYMGWVQTAALLPCSHEQAAAYQAACQAQVITDLLPAWSKPCPAPALGDQCGKLPFGIHLSIETWQDRWAQVRLPDGRAWWVLGSGLLLLEQRPEPDQAGIAFTLDLIRRFVGVPYLWGGRTPFGYDCSGLAQAFWGFMGVSLPRDADQQYRAGVPVEGVYEPGDLLFFGERRPDQLSARHACITHVAISLGGDEIIHANGSAWGTSYNSLNPSSPIYRPWLRDNLIGVRRYGG